MRPSNPASPSNSPRPKPGPQPGSRPTRLLVTGGAGFIGGTFIRRVLRQTDCQVLNLDLLTYAGNLDSLADVLPNPRHQFVQADIRDRQALAKAVASFRPDRIVHFAAESHVDRSIGSPATFVETNVLGTQNLLDVAREFYQQLPASEQASFRFLHVSTDEVYGSLGATGKFTEQTSYAPNSPYSASKAASDHLVRAYFHTYGLPTLISNCSNNYGPFQFPEKLIPLMILNALEGRDLPVYGDGQNIRDWLHVEDHCAALQMILASGRPGEVYNVGGDAERTNLQVVHLICDLVDELRPGLPHAPCRGLIRYVTDRPGHDRRYAIDSTKLQTELGWRPEHDFESGLRETVTWYLTHATWVRRVSDGTYQRERLGLLETTPAAPAAESSGRLMKFREGPIADLQMRRLRRFEDRRGWLIELFRNDELSPSDRPVMAYVSQTEPGVVRGPHEHVEQTDLFAFVGPSTFRLQLWDARPQSPTYGHYYELEAGEQDPALIAVPPGVVHAYRNVGNVSGWVFNAPNALYAGQGKTGPVDEIRHEEDPASPFNVESPVGDTDGHPIDTVK